MVGQGQKWAERDARSKVGWDGGCWGEEVGGWGLGGIDREGEG